jgi:ribosomal protein S18 acetylase RimI-like enzyme
LDVEDTISGIRIIELPLERWREYKVLRLTALQSDPLAFGSTYEETLEYPDELWQERLSGQASLILFAERDGRLVGTAAVLLEIEEDAATAQIVGVFVEREYRGQGIARRLIEALLERVTERAEFARVLLHVTETQAAAYALYRSMGFEEVGRLVGEHRDGDQVYDELVMQRENRW